MMQGRDVLIYLSLKHQGDWGAMFDDVKAKRIGAPPEEVERIVKEVKSKVVTILDDDYPGALRTLYRPPLVLFYYGDISLIADYRKCLSIVGTREPSSKSEELVKEIASGMAKHGYSVVSGLAKGIDASACVGAIDEGKAVAFIGCGIDYVYPSCNSALFRRIKKEGLLCSEYPGRTAPNTQFFPNRNRMLAGISKATLIAEAGPHSGTMITASYAVEFGRELGVIPRGVGETNSYGNRLIREGATLIETLDDVLELLDDDYLSSDGEK